MFGFFARRSVVDLSNEATTLVEGTVKRVLEGATGELKEAAALTEKLAVLRKQVTDLEVAKSRKEEEFAKREREVEHMVGLERKRQEFELSAAKREATINVREQNLTADRKRFDGQMEFQNKRFTEEVGYLKDTLGQVLSVVTEVQKAKNRPAKRG